MNPENLSASALRIFNSLPDDVRWQAIQLTATHSEDEAVYLAAMSRMSERERRKLIFRLSRERWKV